MRPRASGRLVLLTVVLAVQGCAIPRWPVEGTITSPYGLRWRALLPELHRGVDIDVPSGTTVRAMAGGWIRFAGTMNGYGNVVRVDHGGEVLTVYAHLSELWVRTGDVVAGRAVIGLSGATGDAVAPHLHFELWRWARERDPVPLLGTRP